MSGFDPIPEENLAWDYYYKLYYDDDDEFVPPENQNYIYTTPMAEGGYDPTTENENPALDIALDNDDDDDDTTPPPGTPGATSTPYPPGAAYHPGEEHEMTTFPQEQTGVVEGPGESAWTALKGIFPDVSATEVEAYMDPKSKRLMIKKSGAGQTPYALYTQERATGIYRLNPKIPPVLRASLGESAVAQSAALQQERDRNTQVMRAKEQTKQQLEEAAEHLQEERQIMKGLRDRIRRLDDDIRELEDKAGPWDEVEIQRRKDEKRALDAEHQRKREQYDQADADAQKVLQLQVEINDLKLANRDIDRKINKLGIKVRKPLEELEQEKAELKKRRAEGQRVLDDENSSPSEREAANKQVEQADRALERINEDIESEAEKLPLKERVKRIFEKYGWTLQAVVLAAGITISAVVKDPQAHEVVSRCRPLSSAKQQSPPKQAHLQQRGPCSHDAHQPGPLRVCLWLGHSWLLAPWLHVVVGLGVPLQVWLHVGSLWVLTPGLLLPVYALGLRGGCLAD